MKKKKAVSKSLKMVDGVLPAKPVTLVKRRVGRPSIFDDEIVSRICALISNGNSLRSICQMEGMPGLETVFSWLRQNKDFQEQYARAAQERSDAMAEDILAIADESLKESKTGDAKRASAKVQSMRLRVDTRKWLMSKMQPKKYGDKLDMTSGGEPLQGNTIVFHDFQIIKKIDGADSK